MKMNQLLEVLNADTFAGYIDEQNPDDIVATELERFFPVMNVIGLDYSYVKHSRGQVELTAPSAYDSEPISQHRENFDAKKGEMPLFRRKMTVSEKERAQLVTLLALNQYQKVHSLVEYIFNDEMRLVRGAMMTQEYMRAKALMDGVITIESKGGAVNVDYDIPAGHKHTLTGTDRWSDTTGSDPISDIIEWCEDIEDEYGIRPDTMVMNRTTFRLLRAHPQVKAYAFPTDATDTGVGKRDLLDAQVSSAIEMATGVSIIVYNKRVTMDGSTLELIENNKIALFAGGQLGNTLVGTSPAEQDSALINDAGGNVAVTGAGYAINTYMTNRAPYTITTELEFVGLPTFLESDHVVLATVA